MPFSISKDCPRPLPVGHFLRTCGLHGKPMYPCGHFRVTCNSGTLMHKIAEVLWVGNDEKYGSWKSLMPGLMLTLKLFRFLMLLAIEYKKPNCGPEVTDADR